MRLERKAERGHKNKVKRDPLLNDGHDIKFRVDMDSLHRNEDLKIAVAAVFSIVVVVAIATGVALSENPSQPTGLEQSSISITDSEDAQKPQGIDDVAFDIINHHRGHHLRFLATNRKNQNLM